jgi:hypothetical protein
MRWWLALAAGAAGAAGCHGLLGLDDVGYREPSADGGAGGTGGGDPTGGGGAVLLDGTPRWLVVLDDQIGAAEGAAQRSIDGVFDARGHVVIAISFDGTVNLTNPTPTSTGAPDVLLVTIDEDGDRLRHRSYGGTKGINAQLATVGNEIFVSGGYYEPAPVNVGGLDLSAACTLAVDQTDCPADAYAIKYDEDIDLRWRRSDGPGTSEERATAIAALPDGVVVAGIYHSAVSIYGEALTHSGGRDAYLVRLKDEDHAGTPLWIATGWNGAGEDTPLAVDARKATIAVALQSSGATESFVVRALSPTNGAEKWTNPPAFLGSIAALDVAVAPDESVVAAALLSGEATTPDAALIAPAAMNDLVIVRFDASGKVVWLRKLSATGPISTGRVAIDGQNHIAVGGTFQGTLNLGDGLLLDAGDSVIGFVAKLDADGHPIWSRTFSPPGAAIGASIVSVVDVMPEGDVLVAGAFAGTIDFELTQVPSTPGADLDRSLAAFATRLGP